MRSEYIEPIQKPASFSVAFEDDPEKWLAEWKVMFPENPTSISTT